MILIDFLLNRSTKVAPVITQEYTTSLEDRIIERIKASRFDDPTPRTAYNPIIDGDENNGDGELSQEKSKVGLGEVSVFLHHPFLVLAIIHFLFFFLSYMPKNSRNSNCHQRRMC